MATTRARRGGTPDEPPVGTTGRWLVLLDDTDLDAGLRALRRAGVRRTAMAAEAPEGPAAAGLDAVVYEHIGVAVMDAAPARTAAVRSMVASTPAILAVEPERYVWAIGADDYARGYRDGVADLSARLDVEAGTTVVDRRRAADAVWRPNDRWYTWGLGATRVADTARTGRGIKLAVLDTGIDLRHPDLVRRTIVSRSFVAGETVQDGNGHGTHTAGTAAGPARPASGAPRYGVATQARLHVGKVLGNSGSGTDGQILAALDWALGLGCEVVSMSLGAPAMPGDTYSAVYERVGRRALAQGTLIVAAAGNESSRPFRIAPVGHPANCPSFLAVAAVDPELAVAPFSCGAVNPDGGEVDIAGPGVAVDSAWPRPVLRRSIAGTSMATPHVAGVAALWAESERRLRGRALWERLTFTATVLPGPASDVGAGLVHAPV